MAAFHALRIHLRQLAWSVLTLASLISGVQAVAQTSAPQFSAASLTEAELPIADRVVVNKSERRLHLYRRGQLLRSYAVHLGLRPEGPKEFEGDFRTPEGRYTLGRRNSQSDYFLSIQINYPNDRDLQRARKQRVKPGGLIMIHGLPNSPRRSLDYYQRVDWTDGCIALNNSDMVEVWLMTRPGTLIDITP